MDYDLTDVMQESLLTLLCMDDRNAPIIRNSLPASAFEGVYGEIARAVYPYIDEYKEAPKANLEDVLDPYLGGKTRQSKRVKRGLDRVELYWSNRPNAEMIMSRLGDMLKYHRVEEATQEILNIFNSGVMDKDALDKLDGIFNRVARDKIEAFDPGVKGGDAKSILPFLFRDKSEEVFPTGIKQLDRYLLGPARKKLHMLAGLAKTGKTRWLVQLSKNALMQGWRVMYISLEMDQEDIRELCLQSWFSFADRRQVIRRARLKTDRFGRLERIRVRKARLRIALDDRGARKKISERIHRHRRKLSNLLVKSFPTKQLTFGQLVAYIDRMEIQEGFTPDLLLIDYPKLMKFDNRDTRLGLGEIVEQLRGLASERNLAVATVGQIRRINKRDGEDTGSVDTFDIGEDYSQVQTADIGLVFRRSKMEKRLGLARILVDTVRKGSPGGWEILISQNYAQGQFCVDSVMMRDRYAKMINEKAEDGED